MYEAYVQSASAKIRLILEKDTFEKIISDSFFYSYIPSVRIINFCNSYDATIYIEEKQKNILDIKYPVIHYEYTTLNTKDIITLIEYIFERARQERGIMCIHGASAILNDKAVIFWGPATGMGKTTLALRLSEKADGFYSDEKILIDVENRRTVGRIENQYISNIYWKNILGDKGYYKPQNLMPDREYDIKLFVYPLICEQKEFIIEEWNRQKFLWHLYEESSRKIRGTSRVLFSNTLPVESLDTFSISVTRLNMLKDFTKNIKAIYYKGDYSRVIDIIKNKY